MEDKQSLDALEQRKERLSNYLKDKYNYFVYIILAFLIWFGYYIRTRNLDLLKDVTTGKYIPLALDPFVFLRYVRYILEHGALMVNDVMRYYPKGFDPRAEFSFLSNFVVYLFKFLNTFNSGLTLEKVHVLYPAIAFAISLIFFFLLVRKLFDYRVALLATTFLVILPTYLYRTMAGFSDKESLAMLFIFMSLYFYVSAWKSKKLQRNLLFGVLSGITTAFAALIWGGTTFVFFTIGLFVLVEVILNKFAKKDFYVYLSWIIPITIILPIYGNYTLDSLVTSLSTGVAFFALLMGILSFMVREKNIFNLKTRLSKYPTGLVLFVLTAVVGLVIISIYSGPSYLFERLSSSFTTFISPFSGSRWSLTVAEAHQPYLINLIGNLNSWYFYSVLIASVLLFYEMIRSLKHSKKLTALYTLFIFSFVFSRYSPDSVLNGVNSLSSFLFVGSLTLFALAWIGIYVYSFYKDKDLFGQILGMDKTYIFVLIWFLLMVVAARSAVRLFFIFTPITAVLFSYLVFKGVDFLYGVKDNLYKILGYGFIILVVVLLFNGFAKSTFAQSAALGPSYNQQWQHGMSWVRENTPEDSVFAHWWDYGYWVQTGGERATITDGGNTGGASLNYFMGRNVLTAPNEEDALEFLKTRGATHLLMISDEVGKYPAFSSIGSNYQYDRYSWIGTYSLDLSQTQETRDDVIYFYGGGSGLDEDMVYNGQLLPRRSTVIYGFFVPMAGSEDGSASIGQPMAVLFYNDQRFDIPVECIFIENQEINFGGEGLKGCLRFIPSINSNNEANPLGAILYLSERVRNTLFTKLYLYGEESNNFKLVYNDENSMPLAVYRGSVIGPLKIWEISYPGHIEENPIYLNSSFPDPKANLVNPEYY